MKIKTRLLILYTLITTGSVLILSLYALTEFRKINQKSATYNSKRMIEQISYNINSYIDEIYRLTEMPYYFRDILTLLQNSKELDIKEQYQKNVKLVHFLEELMILPRKDIQQVSIFSDELISSHRNYETIANYEIRKDKSWVQRAFEQKEPFLIVEKSIDEPQLFSVVNVIRNMKDMSDASAVIRVDAEMSAINKICSGVQADNSGGVIILTEDNEIFYNNLNKETTSEVIALLSEMHSADQLQISTAKYIIMLQPLSRFGLSSVIVYSLDDLNIRFLRVELLFLAFVLVLIIFILLVFYLIINRLFKPFYNIVDLMYNVENGNTNSRYDGKETNEFGYLGLSLNKMLDSLESSYDNNIKLSEQVYQEKIVKRNFQLKLLYSQIKPHFIYNTLNMISILIQNGSSAEAVQTINELSSLLRRIAYIDHEITLIIEKKLLDAYISIQKKRLDFLIDYSFEMDNCFNNIRVPPLLLQPVVENSIEYANPRGNYFNLKIKITIERTEDFLKITVYDNGDGIDSKTLHMLRQSITVNEINKEVLIDIENIKHLGLNNIQQRLKMMYGKLASLEIYSQKGKGTQVIFLIPYNRINYAVENKELGNDN